MASSEPLAAGPAAAAAVVLAAGLAELTASVARDDETVKAARALRAKAEELGREDASAYAELRRTRSAEARERTIELPARIGELAAEAAELAALAASRAAGASRHDAGAGTILAEAAARVALLLVEANAAGEADPRLARARASLERARALSGR